MQRLGPAVGTEDYFRVGAHPHGIAGRASARREVSNNPRDDLQLSVCRNCNATVSQGGRPLSHFVLRRVRVGGPDVWRWNDRRPHGCALHLWVYDDNQRHGAGCNLGSGNTSCRWALYG